MKVLAFILGMFVAGAGVGLLSAAAGAPIGVIALRVVATLILAQLLYLGLILLMARANRREDEARPEAQPAKPPGYVRKATAPSRSPR